MKSTVRPNSSLRSSIRFTTCARIDTSSAETGSSATRKDGLHGQRAGDADALALAAGELVRVAPGMGGRQAHALQQVGDAFPALGAPGEVVDVQGLADDLTHGHARVEARERILEDDLHAPPVLAHGLRGERRDVRRRRRRLRRRWAR